MCQALLRTGITKQMITVPSPMQKLSLEYLHSWYVVALARDLSAPSLQSPHSPCLGRGQEGLPRCQNDMLPRDLGKSEITSLSDLFIIVD